MGVFRQGFKSMFQRNKWRIMRGDKVMVTAGKDAGQVGTVLKVIRDPKWPRVVVEGQNLVRRRRRRRRLPPPPAAAAACKQPALLLKPPAAHT